MTTAKERTPTERYMFYCRGFGDGARVRASRHPGEPDYEKGYEEGLAARGQHVTRFCRSIGYVPDIMRDG